MSKKEIEDENFVFTCVQCLEKENNENIVEDESEQVLEIPINLS
jgi:hypothetical protein